MVTDFLRQSCGFRVLLQAKALGWFGARSKNKHQLIFSPGVTGWPFTHAATQSSEHGSEVGRISALQRETGDTGRKQQGGDGFRGHLSLRHYVTPLPEMRR